MALLEALTNFPNGILTSVLVLSDFDYKDPQDGAIIFTNLEASGVPNDTASALAIDASIDVTGAVTSNFSGMTLNTIVTGANSSSNIITGLTLNLDSTAVTGTTPRPLGIGLDIIMPSPSNFSSYTGIYFRGGTLPPPITGNFISHGISIAAITHDSVAGTSTVVRSLNVGLPLSSAAAGGSATNYGIYISGDGHASATANWAIYSASTAASLLTGPLTVAVINDSANASATVFGTASALTLNSTLNVVGGANANILQAFRINILPTGAVPVSTSSIMGIYMAPDYTGISGANKPASQGIYIAPVNTTNKLRSFTGFVLDPFTLGVNATGNSSADGITISQMTNNSSGSAIVVNRAINITVPQGDASAGGTARNYGIYVTGNGHASATANYAIYSDSTASSLLTGPLTVATINDSVNASPSVAGTATALTLNSTINVAGGGNANSVNAFLINALPTGAVSAAASNIMGLMASLDFSGLSGNKLTGYGLYISLTSPQTKVVSYTGVFMDPVNLGTQSAASNVSGIWCPLITNNSSGAAAILNKGIHLVVPQGDASAGGTATSYGVFITGNGHASATANWAIFSNSTAPSQLTGAFTAAAITGTSLNAGSGAITTTGAVNTGSVAATAGITAGTTITATTSSSAAQVFQTEANGARLEIRSLTELTTIAAAATTTTTMQIPANAVVLAVSARIITSIPTATFWGYGVTGTPQRYGTSLSVVAPSTFNGTLPGPIYYATATPILITPQLTPATATGQVRFTIHYYITTPPTS